MYFSGPFELYFDITSKCNLNCVFCMRNWDHYPKYDHPDLIKGVKDIMIDNNVPGIVITGGEPFLNSELLDLVAFLKENGKRVTITTNGTLLNRDNIEYLRSVDIDEIQVSIHSADDIENDDIMAKIGSTKKIKRSIDLLTEMNVRFSTKTTVISKNIHSIPSLYNYLKDTGCFKMKFSEVFALGAASENDIKPDIMSLRELGYFFAGMSDKRVQFQSETLSAIDNGYPVKCTMGDDHTFSCEVLSDGTLIPCAFSIVFGKKISIFDSAFSDCFKKLSDYKKYIVIPEKCIECELSDDCRGGCPARRYLYNAAIDPVCIKGAEYEKKMEKTQTQEIGDRTKM